MENNTRKCFFHLSAPGLAAPEIWGFGYPRLLQLLWGTLGICLPSDHYLLQ
jgi:hypothetical protein